MATNKKFNSNLFAKDIIAKRNSENISIRTAADKIGVSVKTVFNAEDGNSQTMAIENIVAICNYIQQPITKYF